ncbi:hypothetical protein CH294_10855 [Rhodococcus sp. 14-2483-1-1]|uniref:daptide biosynthesis RiPP recognition protein n=1 Tax=Rhodococcus sp. 14-2483-1-1 TaxID=2023148 RepID=UPI000B9BDC0A|nr:daptide biosynthesis RiPP recognition protein [Rhodococcus sp. 14-2483-1-1]OZF36880.1 hypothetical protein CH294_10855 [Rhodococcus sp. 14-2483-1-1]
MNVKKNLMSWATGVAHGVDTVPSRAATVIVDHGADIDAVRNGDLVGPGTVLFVPEDAATEDAAAHLARRGAALFGYSGSASVAGDEFSPNRDFYLELQTYGVAAFVSVIGPTVVRIADIDDFESYLADADAAHSAGQFAEFMTNPAVQLADATAFGAYLGDDGPELRVFVGSDSVSTSPAGLSLGDPTTLLRDLRASWDSAQQSQDGAFASCGVCTSQAVDSAARRAALEQRPWLAHYLDAVAALRDLRARGIEDATVLGFGEEADPDNSRKAGEPVVLQTTESAYLHDPRRNRTVEMPRLLAPAALAVTRGLDASETSDLESVRAVTTGLWTLGFGSASDDLVGTR